MTSYTPKEIAEMLSISYHKVLDIIALGKLGAYKVQGVYRISEHQFQRYLESVKVKSYWNKDNTCNTY